MTNLAHLSTRILNSRLQRTVLALATIGALTMTSTLSTQAQTFTVLHSFTGGPDGANPLAGVSMDQAGNLYGTASLGGLGYGAVYKLAPHGTSWVLNSLYEFRGGSDGFYPEARVIIASDGTLYGTTFYGGNNQAPCGQGDVQTCGTVFHLVPPARVCPTFDCAWTETQIFLGSFDGNPPGLFFFTLGDLIFDPAGNLYGTALQGGGTGLGGGIYQLTPSGGDWTETTILTLGNGGTGGADPFAGVILDNAGNLYGTTEGVFGTNPYPYGTVYELSPSDSGRSASLLYQFQNESDGGFPKADLIMDGVGNLYGTTSSGGTGNGGTVFELTPTQGGGWTFNVLYSLNGPPGRGPFGPVLMDLAGNLYGTTVGGGVNQQGSVFKLTHSGGTWIYSTLHDFTGGGDGRAPYGHLILDANGNLYGTAGWGGSGGNGVVWEITP